MLKCALGPHEGAGGLARPLQDVGEPVALRDFSPVFVRFGVISRQSPQLGLCPLYPRKMG